MIDDTLLFRRFFPELGTLQDADLTRRHLSDLKGSFVDEAAYAAALSAGDRLLYTVATVEPQDGEGALHYAIGRIMPGMVGAEYHMTKGHYHAWRAASELYIGLHGQGIMLLEEEKSGEGRAVALLPNSAVYVPGHTAHRTVNTGDVPLTYLGVYPAGAGHDYAAIAEHNFQQIVVVLQGEAVVLKRTAYLERRGRLSSGE